MSYVVKATGLEPVLVPTKKVGNALMKDWREHKQAAGLEVRTVKGYGYMARTAEDKARFRWVEAIVLREAA